jgi:hypothetical protein
MAQKNGQEMDEELLSLWAVLMLHTHLFVVVQENGSKTQQRTQLGVWLKNPNIQEATSGSISITMTTMVVVVPQTN